MRNNLMGLTLAAILSVGTYMGSGSDFIGKHEGRSYVAYLDAAGVPTICDGHIKGVKLGMTATDRLCDELKDKNLTEAHNVLVKYVKVDLSENPERGLALLSFVFNLGEGNFRSSTLLKHLNAGRTSQACNEFLRWIYAGGKPLQGLMIRRADERALCMKGLY